MPTVVGLDLSLTATGVAIIRGDADPKASTLKTKLTGYPRLEWIRQQIELAVWPTFGPVADLVVVEGPAFGAKGSAYHQLAGLWWLITWHLDRSKIPFAVAPPAAVKRYATGRGNADKDAVMLATARAFAWFTGDNNAADATWLAAMGAAQLEHPLLSLPQANRTALSGVAWPSLTGRN